MPKGMVIVETEPADPSLEDAYNDWYDHTHLPEVTAVPGIVAAPRYVLRSDRADGGEDPRARYVAVYELDADDLEQPMRDLATRRQDSDGSERALLRMDPPPRVTLYELLPGSVDRDTTVS